jgi:hypothetical protein
MDRISVSRNLYANIYIPNDFRIKPGETFLSADNSLTLFSHNIHVKICGNYNFHILFASNKFYDFPLKMALLQTDLFQ